MHLWFFVNAFWWLVDKRLWSGKLELHLEPTGPHEFMLDYNNRQFNDVQAFAVALARLQMKTFTGCWLWCGLWLWLWRRDSAILSETGFSSRKSRQPVADTSELVRNLSETCSLARAGKQDSIMDFGHNCWVRSLQYKNMKQDFNV